jgi:hypothetical protein
MLVSRTPNDNVDRGGPISSPEINRDSQDHHAHTWQRSAQLLPVICSLQNCTILVPQPVSLRPISALSRQLNETRAEPPTHSSTTTKGLLRTRCVLEALALIPNVSQSIQGPHSRHFLRPTSLLATLEHRHESSAPFASPPSH